MAILTAGTRSEGLSAIAAAVPPPVVPPPLVEPTPESIPEHHESELSQLRREVRQLTGRVAALENKM